MRGRAGTGGALPLAPWTDKFVLDLDDDSVVGGEVLGSAYEASVDDDLLSAWICVVSSLPFSELFPLALALDGSLMDARLLRLKLR